MSREPVKPTKEEFRELAQLGNVVPVYAQLAADFETPLSAFMKIAQADGAFLFESAESTDASGRYSIMGTDPRAVFIAHGKDISLTENGETCNWTADSENDVLSELEALMSQYKPVPHGDAPPFYGGAVGYMSYDAVKQFEPSILVSPPDDLNLPDAVFMIADTLLIFDHKLRRLLVVANAFVDDEVSPDEAYEEALQRIENMVCQLDVPFHISPLNGLTEYEVCEPKSNTTQEEYENMVLKAKEYIASGDAFQVVPSQRFETEYDGKPIDLYRALRHVNPSPYMFILQFDEFSLVGSSPEVHVRAIGGKLDI